MPFSAFRNVNSIEEVFIQGALQINSTEIVGVDSLTRLIKESSTLINRIDPKAIKYAPLKIFNSGVSKSKFLINYNNGDDYI